MELLKLIIKDFKGCKGFILDTRGGNVSVFGDNAVGKTTLMDAVQWLLFGKDSNGKADFEIKPLDSAGNPVHHLTTEVEGSFDLDGKPVALRKTYYEKWTKKRGSVTADFTGHTTDYYIDGVPKPKKDYDAFIASISDESIFKLLTNPVYFNEQLHWQDRRQILLDVCGDISDVDVISSSKKLAKLPDILCGRSLEDHKKVISARQAAINKELREIPARIDEKQRDLPDVKGISKDALEIELNSLKKQLTVKQQEQGRVENGGEVAEKQKALREIEGKLLDIQNRYRADNQDKTFKKKQKLQELQYKSFDIGCKAADKEALINSNVKSMTSLEKSCETLRTLWHEANKKQFEYSAETVCPTCGQALPEEQVQTAIEKAQADFNLKKSGRLESINQDGKKAKQSSVDLKAQNADLQVEFDQLTIEKETIEQSITTLQNEIDSMTAETVPSIENSIEYQKAIQEKLLIEQQIADLNSQQQSVVNKIKDEISAINLDINTRERKLAQIDQSEIDQKRITELETREKTLGAEYEKLQLEVFLTEEFTRTKVNLLESKINSKFKMARFKMFEVQVNGCLNETCITTLNGAPYDGALNSGHKIIVGLDIISTLSKHYGFSAPIFVDNAESVTELPSMDAQVIRLVVSKPDKVLRVEHEVPQKPIDESALGENLFREEV